MIPIDRRQQLEALLAQIATLMFQYERDLLHEADPMRMEHLRTHVESLRTRRQAYEEELAALDAKSPSSRETPPSSPRSRTESPPDVSPAPDTPPIVTGLDGGSPPAAHPPPAPSPRTREPSFGAKLTEQRKQMLAALAYGTTAMAVVGMLLRMGQQPPSESGKPDNPAAIPVEPEDVSEIRPFAFCPPSAEGWISQALTTFEKQNGLPHSEVMIYGSRDGKQCILYGQKIPTRSGKGASSVAVGHPSLYIADHPYWAAKLEADWIDPNVIKKDKSATLTTLVGPERPVIARTRLVFVMPPRRAAEFAVAVGSGSYAGRPWALLRDLTIGKGWGVIDPASAGERARLFLPDPTRSHAGLIALASAYAEFCDTQAGSGEPQLKNPKFWVYVSDLVRATPQSETSAQFTLSSPDARTGDNDIVICDEAEAYQAMVRHRGTAFHVVYPSPNPSFDLAAISLNRVNSTTGSQAIEFSRFLLSDPAQQLALTQGYHSMANLRLKQKFTGVPGTAGFNPEAPTHTLVTVPGTMCRFDAANKRFIVGTDALTYLPRVWYDIAVSQAGDRAGQTPRLK